MAFAGLRSRRLQANGYWVLNHHRFSYPAVFTQSYLQKRSCGSVVLGLSLHAEQLELDTDALPDNWSLVCMPRCFLRFPLSSVHA
ncbi:DUF4421 family protein [uncultured Bacteroides sp.]|uniref:DUF4421 family protein n=1 Tax=uncultured Bacteroides sp. TaxID=162156 RepID=UPI002606B27A|nr:DUF4421 family protein [uncultured Bacteroides sp.]